MSVYTLSDLTNNNSDLLQGASKHSCPICSSRAQTSDSSAERSAAQASAFSNSNDIDALLARSRANPGQLAKWNVAPGGTITYSFVTADSAASYFASRNETNIEEVNDRIKQNVRQILRDNYATVLPLNFVEVPDSAQSNIRIMFSDGPGAENMPTLISRVGCAGAPSTSKSSMKTIRQELFPPAPAVLATIF
jgi:hypothetical protein